MAMPLSEINDIISASCDSVRATAPLVHCITNYVTVESCANAVLAVGGSPIMSDEPADVEDITSICDALVINIGTLNQRSIESMKVAGAKAAELGHPIVLDPVGAGASRLRTEVAGSLLETLPIALVRGNMSEVKALAGAASATKGVDVNPEDIVGESNIETAARFAREFAERVGCVVAITGPVDIVADANRAFAVRNGSPLQGRITGSGCMLSALSGAYIARREEEAAGAALAAVIWVSQGSAPLLSLSVCREVRAVSQPTSWTSFPCSTARRSLATPRLSRWRRCNRLANTCAVTPRRFDCMPLPTPRGLKAVRWTNAFSRPWRAVQRSSN
ncbi:hydroxyethylthiazole kinase [uncultured Slackia sp.]|uniref:hydroxyethylthiazole kinase n=1 Tax=uncultured Slackia sp. TaxID=665903 RepID=UPI0028048303|nr:hydroxyethylthiazole kinase [uncultured Slackia sp.]